MNSKVRTGMVLAMWVLGVAVCGAGLVAHLPFNGNVEDASGNGNHGTATAGIRYVPGRFGQGPCVLRCSVRSRAAPWSITSRVTAWT